MIMNKGTTWELETAPACGGGRQECLPHCFFGQNGLNELMGGGADILSAVRRPQVLPLAKMDSINKESIVNL